MGRTVRYSRARYLTALAVTLALVLAGCGSSSSSSSGVSAASYVHAVCTAASSWYQTIKTAGAKLQLQAHSLKSIPATKAVYVKFVNSLSSATATAENQIKSAGTPSVSGGKTISSDLVRAFGSAEKGLKTASVQVSRAPTSSASAFESVASQTQSTIGKALSSLASLGYQHYASLKSAASKDPTCQKLKSL